MTLSSFTPKRARRLWIALGLNVVIVAVQLGFGFAAHSLGLLADAGHNFTDVAAVGTSLIAVQWAMRSPTERRSFGYHRGTILAALTNSLSILAITIVIGFEAIRRLLHPSHVHGGIVVAVALGAALINGVAALALREGHTDHAHSEGAGQHETRDLNMRSALLHMVGDAVASVGVAIAGAVILITGRFFWLDSAASLAIGLLIAWQAIKLLVQAISVLLESTPSDVDLRELTKFMADLQGIEAVHDLHVWSLSSEVRALSAHLVLDGDPTLRQAQVIGDRVKSALGDRFSIAHATLELEGEHCNDGTDDCAMGEVTPAQRHRRL
jgi:cobalt-zinc-cadmium efflux system protein